MKKPSPIFYFSSRFSLLFPDLFPLSPPLLDSPHFSRLWHFFFAGGGGLCPGTLPRDLVPPVATPLKPGTEDEMCL